MEHVLGVVMAFAFIGVVVWGAVRLYRAGKAQQTQMRAGLMQELGVQELSKHQIERLDLPVGQRPHWAAAGTFLGRELMVSAWVSASNDRPSSYCGVRVKAKGLNGFRLEIRRAPGGGTPDERLSEVSPGDLGLDDRWSVRSTDAVRAKRIIPNDKVELLRQVLTHEDSPRLLVGESSVFAHEDSPDILTELRAVEVCVPASLMCGRELERLLPDAAVLCCAIADELDETS